MRLGSKAILLLLVLGALLLAAPGAASAKTFTVNVTTDITGALTPEVIDGVCDANDDGNDGLQCEIRGAVAEANATGAADTIKFSSSFNGELADFIQLSNGGGHINLGGLNQSLTINGGDCGDESISHKPCVEVRAPTDNASRVFAVSGGAITIRGLAITNGHDPGGLQEAAPTSTLKVTNTWFGVNLDGTTLDPNEVGISIDSGASGAVIGGTSGSERNVFAGGTHGIRISNGDENRIRGNYFGVMPDGVTAAPAMFGDNAIDIRAPIGFGAEDNVIGASISSSHRATAKCDGGCNVIANAAEAGVDLDPVPAEQSAVETKIKGNFIGLSADGSTGIGNDVGVETGESSSTTIGGNTSAERNFITGGSFGIDATTDDPPELSIKRNFIGLNSAGTAELDAPTDRGIVEDSGNPVLLSRNRLVGANGAAIQASGFRTRVVRNKVGLDKNGNDEPAPTFGIFVTANQAIIGEPGAGNTIGNTASAAIYIEGTGGGDENKVQGNFIGVDSAGASHPNAGDGIRLQKNSDTVDDNVIGGTSGATENVISNSRPSSGDAVALIDGTLASTGNQIKRNRGKNNGSVNGGGMFIDLGDNGPGNPGVNQGINAPVLADAAPGDTTRTHTEGTCAEGHTVYIFRTSNADGDAPNRINAFVKMASCGITHVFSANFSKIPSGQSLTALNLDNVDGSSELATAVAPPGP